MGVARVLWATVLLHVAAAVALLAVYVYATGTQDLSYRLSTSITALSAIMRLPEADVTSFISAYSVFNQTRIVTGTPDEAKVVDYYRVINHLCALGEVEKMYIPPVISMDTGVYGNQLLFERQMVQALGLLNATFCDAEDLSEPCTAQQQHQAAAAGSLPPPLPKVDRQRQLLELGCGRGRIANHVARLSGARVTGINLDDGVQIESARAYARQTGLEASLEFRKHSYNDLPLPFADASFDAFYHVQALTYVHDLRALLRELHRVLRPGARLSFLDWFVLDAYDARNATHVELLEKTKAIIGAVYTPHPSEYERALADTGFKVLISKEASVVGHQYPLIQKARDFFMPVGTAVRWLARLRLLPQATDDLLARLNLYVDDFITSDELGLFTTSYWIVAERL